VQVCVGDPQEFEAWLKDIKKITEFNGPKWQQMELFKEYCEEYNTCTLPSEKSVLVDGAR
jgi:hypothetical protein